MTKLHPWLFRLFSELLHEYITVSLYSELLHKYITAGTVSFLTKDKEDLWLIKPNMTIMVIIKNNQMSLSGIYSWIYRLQHDHYLSL